MIIPEQRVILAVINQAIIDSCLRPLKSDDNSEEPQKMARDARSAMNFLFTSTLDAYAGLVDISPDWLRNSLLNLMYNKSTRPALMTSRGQIKIPFIGELERRSFRVNHRLWMLNPNEQVIGPSDSENDRPKILIIKSKTNQKVKDNDGRRNPKNAKGKPAGSMAIRSISTFLATKRDDCAAGNEVDQQGRIVRVGQTERLVRRTARGEKK